jgi:hypothetical protein
MRPAVREGTLRATVHFLLPDIYASMESLLHLLHDSHCITLHARRKFPKNLSISFQIDTGLCQRVALALKLVPPLATTGHNRKCIASELFSVIASLLDFQR